MGYCNCNRKEKEKEKEVKVIFVKPGEKVLVVGKKDKHLKKRRTCKPYYY
ncbi:hypothetical protein [Paenibacillus prosopidis]|uniref:Uncharacterized protein n=1 Tax=Paenibacillus prosopidis TaxID=630520 RepID=A0A368W3J5_9BACL|nr:hypothetical protein [Paenibacillus prosopidis]RCW46595.1 hypothetical protein DFP97_109246 [Paenibacillus prosopidis]